VKFGGMVLSSLSSCPLTVYAHTHYQSSAAGDLDALESVLRQVAAPSSAPPLPPHMISPRLAAGSTPRVACVSLPPAPAIVAKDLPSRAVPGNGLRMPAQCQRTPLIIVLLMGWCA